MRTNLSKLYFNGFLSDDVVMFNEHRSRERIDSNISCRSNVQITIDNLI
jgi:hypothetical protein